MPSFEQKKGAELLRSHADPQPDSRIGDAHLPSRADLAKHLQAAERTLGAQVNDCRLDFEHSTAVIPVNQDLVDRAGKLLDAFRPGFLGLHANGEKALEALNGLSKSDMAELARMYEDRTRSYDAKHDKVLPGRELAADIDSKLSGLRKEAALALIDGNSARADAIELRTKLAKLNMGAESAAEIIYRNSHAGKLDDLKREYANLFGRDLSKVVRDNINGDMASVVRPLIDGKELDAALAATQLEKKRPNVAAIFEKTAIDPQIKRADNPPLDQTLSAAEMIFDKERHNGLAAYALRAAGAPVARQLKRSDLVMNAEARHALTGGAISVTGENRLREDAAFVVSDGANFRSEKIHEADVLSTGAAAVAGAAIGNPAGGMFAGAVVKPLTRKVLAGTDYSLENVRDVAFDAAKGAGAGALGAGASKVAGINEIPNPLQPIFSGITVSKK